MPKTTEFPFLLVTKQLSAHNENYKEYEVCSNSNDERRTTILFFYKVLESE
jgi:hypothetical protein